MFRTRLATDRVRSTRSRPSYLAHFPHGYFVSCCSRSAFFSRGPMDDFDISFQFIGFFESSEGAKSFSTSAACSRVMWLTESLSCVLN